MASSKNSHHHGADMYDFSGVAGDLAILHSQLFKHSSILPTVTMDTCPEDDEEWYPPSPPIYDVTDKLIEVNREFYDDPTSTLHLAGRLRWKSDSDLVQIRWLYSDCDTVYQRYSDDTEDDTSSDEPLGLAAQLAQEMSARLHLFPPKIELATIEDVSPDTSEKVTEIMHQDYDDEDFEEPSLAEDENNVLKSPFDNDVVSHMETIEMSSVSSTASSDSCKTTKVSFNSKKAGTGEANNNEVRPSRPRTKTTVVRTHSAGSGGSSERHQPALVVVSPRSSSFPKQQQPQQQLQHNVSNTTKMSSSSLHARIKMAHSRNNNNNNNSCSSSGEEGSSASVSSHPRSSSLTSPLRSSSLQPTKTRKVITETRPKTTTTTTTTTTNGGPPSTSSSSASGSMNKSKSSVYISATTTITTPGLNGVPARPHPAAAYLQRKNSRNSLSSNSSVSSQTTEDGNTSSANSMNSSAGGGGGGGGRRSSLPNMRPHHRHPSVVADVISPEQQNFIQWKMRKREEKKLRARKSFLEQQMRRH